MLLEKGKSLGNKVVLAKIPREEFSRFQQYCDQNGETINASLRRMILNEINNPQPSRIAAQSIFRYNKDKDNFEWLVASDDGKIIEVDRDLPANSAEQMLEALIKSIEERNSFIKRSNKNSVSYASRILRKRR